MKRIIIVIAFIGAVWGCSPGISKINSTKQEEEINKAVNKKIAAEKFIQGSVLEAKGLYNEAIKEYLEAAKYDTMGGIYYSLAKNYYRINKLSSALQYSRKSTILEPDNVNYLELLASIYSASLLNDSSIIVYEKIIKQDSTNAAAYFQLAQLSESKRPNQAIEYYKKVIDMVGPDWNVLIRMTDLNERMGDINETIKMVEALIKLNPSDLQLQKILIDAYIKSKNYESALKLTDEALISFPDDLGLIELKGNIYISESRWPEAFEVFKTLVKNDTIGIEDKLKLSSFFLSEAGTDSSNLNLAYNLFREIAVDSSDWQTNAYLGEIAIRQKKDSLAISHFKKAISNAEWNSQLWGRLGGILFDNGKYDEAMNFMEDASVKFPNDFLINLIYGLSLAQKNIHDKAVIYFKRTLNINPNDITTLSALGFSLNQLKNDDEALNYLNRALSIEQDNIQVISQAALIYESRKDYILSDSLYNKALELDSSNALILNNYAYSLSERGKDIERALKMSLKAVEQEPENPSYLDTIGWIYFVSGDLEKAKKYIEQSIKLDDKSATVLDHMGDVYFKLGNKTKANDYWQQAIKIDPGNDKLKSKIEKGTL